ncbi:putative signaling protein [bioreactor metagenome]|uniref:Putative signaling protein n=1 Tax=bioreactor metagenome TaxID=1076179 RepID=A0A645DJK8_9ZZZZ
MPKRQLQLFYQPQISLASGKIVGVEALLRWQLPGYGILGPGQFIPLSEQSGLIHAIGAWVLEEACTVSKRWHAEGCSELRVAVNVSVHQLRSPGFVSLVEKTLRDSGLEPRHLELEITESAATGSPEGVVQVLHQLKSLGVCLAIDDFGIQYSSLSRLKQLPVDRIKMDLQFIQGLEYNKKDREISMVIIHLARSLGLGVVAEGVENAAQYEFLRLGGCDEVQGYYCHRPMPVEAAEAVLLRELIRPEALI